MYYKVLLHAIALFIAFLLQKALISNLPSFWGYLNFLIVVLVFIILIFDYRVAVWWALGMGLLADAYSFNRFGVYMLTFLATVILADFLLTNVVTDRSLYSVLVLVTASSIVFELVYLVMYNSYPVRGEPWSFQLLNVSDWSALAATIIINNAISVLLFYWSNYLSHSFKPVFITKKYK